MAGVSRIVWRCWKCNEIVYFVSGTFEKPEGVVVGNFADKYLVAATLACSCSACGAYNVLAPAGMHARLQEEEIE